MSLERDQEAFFELRERRKNLIIRTLGQFGILLLVENVVDDMQLHLDQDVHGFYTFRRPSNGDSEGTYLLEDNVLHIQGYPGISTDKELTIMARLMKGTALRDIRARGEATIGNEHPAVLWPKLFETPPVTLPSYSPSLLRQEISTALNKTIGADI